MSVLWLNDSRFRDYPSYFYPITRVILSPLRCLFVASTYQPYYRISVLWRRLGEASVEGEYYHGITIDSLRDFIFDLMKIEFKFVFFLF